MIEAMNLNGRIVVVGRSAHANDPNSHLAGRFVSKRLTARGFIILDQRAQWAPAIRIMGDWVKNGRLRYKDHIVEGLEHAPRAFVEMPGGKVFGKPQVKVGPDPFSD